MGWEVRRNGVVDGPFDEATIAEWARRGMRDAAVRREGTEEWVPIIYSEFSRFLPPVPVRQGMGCGLWVALLVALGLTLGACIAIPQIGWTGWGIIIAIWFIGRHLERQNELLEELVDRHRR